MRPDAILARPLILQARKAVRWPEHGRYRIRWRRPARLECIDGVWWAKGADGRLAASSREWVVHVTGRQPEELAAGGWDAEWAWLPR